MHNSKIITYSIWVLSFGMLSSCYQKKNPSNNLAVSSYEEAVSSDTIIEGILMEEIEYVDTFKLLPTKHIIATIDKNTKKKRNYKLPSNANSTLNDKHQIIERLAIANVYATIGSVTKNKKLYKSAIIETQTHFDLLEDSTSVLMNQPIDTVDVWIKKSLTEQNNAEFAYYEAVKWLENIYITLEEPKTISSLKKVEELILEQFDNGTDMLMRLSNYQDYEPISIFSEHLINLLDCKYFTFDLYQLKQDVEAFRNELLQPNQKHNDTTADNH